MTNGKAGRDKYGYRHGTQGARINAALGTEPKSAKSVAAETGLSEPRVKAHFRWLVKQGWAEGDANEVRLVDGADTSRPPSPQTIRIDPEVWRALQDQAQPFVDAPNDVLRRLLGLDAPKGG